MSIITVRKEGLLEKIKHNSKTKLNFLLKFIYSKPSLVDYEIVR